MREPDRLIVDISPGETRIAALADGTLTDFWPERAGAPPRRVGEIVLARVRAVRPELDAAFLDLGKGEGFLNSGKSRAPVEGALLVVVVTADARGSKQARVSRNVSLRGRYLSLRPAERGLSIAGSIKAKGRRRALGDVLKPRLAGDAGLLVHGDADGAEEADLLADLAMLLAEWKRITGAIAAGEGPQTLRPAPALRDMVRARFPGARVEESRDGAGFVPDDVDGQVERALARRLRLADGTVLTFEQTEALVAVDVDLAAAPRTSRARLFAGMAPVIASELRLRRLSGLVLVDFPELSGKGGRERVFTAMQDAFEGWPRTGSDNDAFPRVSGWTRGGVLEIIVPRDGGSLAGDYLRPAVQQPQTATVALAALRRVLAETGAVARPEMRCAPDVADWLAGPGRAALAEVQERLGGALQVRAQADHAPEQVGIVNAVSAPAPPRKHEKQDVKGKDHG